MLHNPLSVAPVWAANQCQRLIADPWQRRLALSNKRAFFKSSKVSPLLTNHSVGASPSFRARTDTANDPCVIALHDLWLSYKTIRTKRQIDFFHYPLVYDCFNIHVIHIQCTIQKSLLVAGPGLEAASDDVRGCDPPWSVFFYWGRLMCSLAVNHSGPPHTIHVIIEKHVTPQLEPAIRLVTQPSPYTLLTHGWLAIVELFNKYISAFSICSAAALLLVIMRANEIR